jgi:hypothetical protein
MGKHFGIFMAGIGVGVAVAAWVMNDDEVKNRLKKAYRQVGNDLKVSEIWRRGKQAASGAKDRLKDNLSDAIDNAAATLKDIVHQAGEQLKERATGFNMLRLRKDFQ